jgi:copper(I)-binding protein
MRPRRGATGAALLAVSALTAACTGRHAAATPAAAAVLSPAQITVTAAVVVQPVSQDAPAPAYFTVHNPTATDDRITSVTTTAAATTLINNSLSDATGTPGIDVPAETTTALGPFGTDVLLLKPAVLTPGSRVALTVHFAHHTPISVSATVMTVAQAADDRTGTP